MGVVYHFMNCYNCFKHPQPIIQINFNGPSQFIFPLASSSAVGGFSTSTIPMATIPPVTSGVALPASNDSTVQQLLSLLVQRNLTAVPAVPTTTIATPLAVSTSAVPTISEVFDFVPPDVETHVDDDGSNDDSDS